MVTTTTGEAAQAELVETGERRDALGRRRTPARRRAELLEGYRESGVTQREFARREGLNYTTFCTWAQAERRKGKLPSAPAGRRARPGPLEGERLRVPFVEVQLPSSAAMGQAQAAGLEVRMPDGMVLRGTSAAELAKLLRAIRA